MARNDVTYFPGIPADLNKLPEDEQKATRAWLKENQPSAYEGYVAMEKEQAKAQADKEATGSAPSATPSAPVEGAKSKSGEGK